MVPFGKVLGLHLTSIRADCHWLLGGHELEHRGECGSTDVFLCTVGDLEQLSWHELVNQVGQLLRTLNSIYAPATRTI
jgi:hypothetical protein